jgi:hypothetical protein
MKAIVAGGRDFIPTRQDFQILKELISIYKIDIIVSGHAAGADSFGEQTADALSLKKEIYPADWNNISVTPCKIKTRKDGIQYNVLAGFNRNEKMAEVADMLIYFKGGNGTNDMISRAEKHGLKIISAEIAKTIYYCNKYFSIKNDELILDENGKLNSNELLEKYGYFKVVEDLYKKGKIE